MAISKAKTTIALILMFAMAFSLVAIPTANAQDLIMNLPGTEGAPHILLMIDGPEGYDIDMNGGPGPFQNVSLWIKYPGRPDFTFIGTYLTRDQYGGDLDVYDFDFNETGDFECQWRYPPDSPFYPGESNIEIARVITVDMLTPLPTYPFLGATPNPVGVGQEVLLHVGITQALSNQAMGWDDLSVTITKPDGTTETISGIRTDSTGGTGRIYVPAIAGNYTLQTHFPEQQTESGKTSSGVITGTRMLASDSEKLTLVVNEEPVEFYPVAPLPTEYWTRPIDAQHREWYSISQSFFGTIPLDGRFEPGHDDAPESGHILWAEPFTSGGIAGGELLGEHAFECGDAYQGKWRSPGILAGTFIYCHSTGVDPLEYTATDIRTGEVLWKKVFLNNQTIDMLQLFYWDSYNYHGVYPYIWIQVGSTWYAFDPFDTTHRITMTNVPSGTTIIGEKGNIYRYNINLGQARMTMWNWSARISMQGSFRGTGHNTYNCGGSNPTSSSQRRAWALNVSIPEGLPGSVIEVKLGDRVVGASVNPERVITWGFSLKPGQEGQLLFNKTWNAPAEWVDGDLSIGGDFGPAMAISSIEDKVITLWVKETREHYGFSLETGDYLWGPTPPEQYLGIYETWELIAYGRLYTHGMKGMIDCYNVTTGEKLWTYTSADPLSEILWSNNWPIRIEFITDGKIYCRHSEHSPVDPKPRGAPYICIDAITGEELWRLNVRGTDWGGHSIIGDSVILTPNTYDMRTYAIGKGPSAITVKAAPEVSVHGSSVLVKGMVTDVSPGTNDIKLTLRFPNGVPAVAEESMAEWMQYVYMQFPRPTDAVGVEVILTVIDPNNNVYDIGTTTSDSSGMYKKAFIPEVPGEYTVIATFAGSEGYYGSFAETAICVDEAPLPTPPEEPLTLPPTETYITAATIAIIIAIAIVGLLILRKR